MPTDVFPFPSPPEESLRWTEYNDKDTTKRNDSNKYSVSTVAAVCSFGRFWNGLGKDDVRS